MRKRRQSSHSVVAVGVIVACLAEVPSAAAVGLDAYLDERLLVQLADAASCADLDQVYTTLPYHDPVLDIVYRSRRLALHPGADEEKRLLETMPENPLHFWSFYAITYTKAYSNNKELKRIVNAYFEQLARIVVKRREGLRGFLLLSRFSDGEVASDLADWNDFLRVTDPQGFVAALRSLDPEGRRRICGDCSFLHEKHRSDQERR